MCVIAALRDRTLGPRVQVAFVATSPGTAVTSRTVAAPSLGLIALVRTMQARRAVT